jgi:peptide/nickel transport system ATP-binding protein
MALTRLMPEQPVCEVSGDILLEGRNLSACSDREIRKYRGKQMAYIFQEPATSLNPVFTVGTQIAEAIRLHRPEVKDVRKEIIHALDLVKIRDPEKRYRDYPHQLSGGMQQRVMIAMALACRPKLLVADEPTTALDVTIQAGILRLLDDLKAEYGMGVLFVTHDLATVSQIADRVVVLYAGKVMERGTVLDVFERPAHPYTRALLACLPGRGSGLDAIDGAERGGIAGSLPDPTNLPGGCRFAPRCTYAEATCSTGDQPPEVDLDDGHSVSCIHYEPGNDPSVLSEVPEATPDTERPAGDGGSSADERSPEDGDPTRRGEIEDE